MRAAIGPEQRHAAISLLERQLEPRALKRVLDQLRGGKSKKGVEWLYVDVAYAGGAPRSRLPEGERARFLVDLKGLDLLSVRRLRYELAKAAPRPQLERLHDYPNTKTRSRGGRQSKARVIAKRRWQPGKSWPLFFARTLGLPLVFAGLEGSPKPPDVEEVEPFRPLPPLTDFQQDLRDQVLDLLGQPEGQNRGILTLPTGAGKTRTAVEALTDWKASEGQNEVVIWIAQSQELCEQAVQAFREVWTDQGHRHPEPRPNMIVSRLWGPHDEIPADVDVLVATVQKLQSIESGDSGDERRSRLRDLQQQVGVVVVDEAHRALAQSYADVLEFLGVPVRYGATADTPLLGLTATPGRSSEDEIPRLKTRFHQNLMKARSIGDQPLEELRRQGVLSKPDHKTLHPGGQTYELTDTEEHREHYEQFDEIHPDLLRKIAQQKQRNRILREAVKELPEDWPILYFGTSVPQAQAMALLLREAGRSADVITGETRPATRRHLVESFRAGDLDVLCNYGVLTTGFDAPKVRAVVIARPTNSPLLYEQMIGRGMRGPKFGGTERCLILDVQDNITYQGQRAYLRFEDHWD